MDLRDVKRNQELQNQAGVKQKVWVAPIDVFTSIKGVITPAVNDGDSVTIDGAHTFPAGPPQEGFIELHLDYEQNKVDGEPAADPLSQNHKQTFVGFYNASDASAAEMMKELKNREVIFLFEQMGPDGAVRQIGTEENPGRFSYKDMTGQAGSGKNGFEITVTAIQDSLLYYPGTITLKA